LSPESFFFASSFILDNASQSNRLNDKQAPALSQKSLYKAAGRQNRPERIFAARTNP
jgi:hypothetical protein